MEQLLALRTTAFPLAPGTNNPLVRERVQARLPFTRGLFLDGVLVSALVSYPFSMYLAGSVVPMAGLAAIMTAPEYRRLGYVRELLHSTLADLRESGIGWSLEYPFDPAFYRRFGWQSIPNGIVTELPAHLLLTSPPPAAKRISGEQLADLKPIYACWARHYNLTLTRDDEARAAWQRLLMPSRQGSARLAYRLEDSYLIAALREQTGDLMLTVKDYAFASPQGRRALFAFMGNFAGQTKNIRIHLPGDEPLGWDHPPAAGNHYQVLQARVVDVPLALQQLPSSSPARFLMRVHDDFCGWNNRTFRITLHPPGVQVAAASGNAEVTIDVRALALLLSGGSSARALLRSKMAEGEEGCLESLASLAGGRNTFQPQADYF